MLKFFQKPNPEEVVKQWARTMRNEQRKIELQIAKIRREEQKVKVSMKAAAKKDDQVAVRMLAKELLHSRKAVNRLYTACAQMSSVSMQLQNQATQIKLAGTMQKSGEVMKEMNALVNVKQVRDTMMHMSKEMSKAGLIEEMMNDAIDDALDEDISDTELENEVNRVVVEVTQSQMEGARVGTSRLPAAQPQVGEGGEEDELTQRLNALRS